MVQSGFVMKLITAMTLVAFTFAGVTNAAEPQSTPPLGFYAGAEIGTAAAHTDVNAANVWGTNVNTSTTGWSLFAGFRPQKYFGAELDYIDFGKSKVNDINDGNADVIYEASAKNHAIAGYLVAYAPLVPNTWDLFAKIGYARLTTETFSSYNFPNICVGNPCSFVGSSTTSESNTTGDFAYALGTQYRFGSVALRAEYQQINGSKAQPDMFSIGFAWNF